MGFTTESMEAPKMGQTLAEPSEFNLPSKEFVGYDPKGTQSVTGSPLKDNPRQTPIDEASVTAPTETESLTLSPKVSAIARKEQQQRQREKAIAAREAQLEAKLADAEKYAQLKAKLAAKDYSATEELGLDYNTLTEYEINKQSSKDPKEERVQKLEEKLTALEKAKEEQVVEEYKANQVLWKAEITKVVDASEDFITIKELGAYDQVLQHVNESFDEDGIELSVEEAAAQIEEALVERAEKFANLSKFKNKTVEKPKVLGAPTKTITNNMTTLPPKNTSKPFHMLSESEQIAEAIRRVQAAKQAR